MSALHEAVARAIAEWITPSDAASHQRWAEAAAAAASRVVVAEATRSIEARVPPIPAHYCDCEHCGAEVRAEALAALAALAALSQI